MAKGNWTLYIWKVDNRCKRKERLFSTTVWTGRDEAGMQREVEELYLHHYPRSQFRMEFSPTTVEVRNLMTGEMVEIPFADRGGPCDPSMERYWSA